MIMRLHAISEDMATSVHGMSHTMLMALRKPDASLPTEEDGKLAAR
jgi:hypothetical protein